MPHHVSVRRARRQRSAALSGYLVTWDVVSGDRALCDRVRFFVFGRSVAGNGKTYRYPGFVELDGVRYVGQSVLFVTEGRLHALARFLRSCGMDYVVTRATVGPILRQ